MVEISSPLTGMLYTALSSGARPFAEVGTQVKKGDIICVIEAMKMLNEITAPCDGTVAEIHAANDTLVQKGQLLFKVRN